MKFTDISQIQIGQLIQFRSKVDLLSQYEDYVDDDDDILLPDSYYIFNSKMVLCENHLCTVKGKGGTHIQVEFFDKELQESLFCDNFPCQMFETPRMSFELNCKVGSTIDGIYISQNMKDLLKNAGDYTKKVSQGKLYYKILGYYYPSSVVDVINQEEILCQSQNII